MRIQRFDEHRVMPWANGRGTSFEIASDRGADGEWTWRLGLAPVVENGPFSVMPGVDRQLVVIEGEGMSLSINGEVVECPPGQVIRFSGDSTTFARLVDGPVVDLGLMTVRGSITGSMIAVADLGNVIESDVLVAIGDAVFNDENGKNYKLGSKDALLGVRGHQLELLGGTAIAIQVNS